MVDNENRQLKLKKPVKAEGAGRKVL